MREFGKIITRKTDLTDAQVQEKYKFPAIIILHDNEDQILKITHYQKNGTKTIYDFSLSASKQFVTDSIATAIAGLQDNRLEYNEFSDFPAIGDETKFYIDLTEDKIYIWDAYSQTYKNQSWDTATIASLQASIASAAMAFQNLENSKQNKLETISGNTGVGKTDASATEKLDVNGRVKSDGIVINETTSAILPREIKFKDGKFKAALADGVEKSVLLEGDVSGSNDLLVDYTHTANKEIYFSSIDYSTGLITTTSVHGLTGRTRVIPCPNIDAPLDSASNFLSGMIGMAWEYMLTDLYVDVIDSTTLKICTSAGAVITVDVNSAQNLGYINSTTWHLEVYSFLDINLPNLPKGINRIYADILTFSFVSITQRYFQLKYYDSSNNIITVGNSNYLDNRFLIYGTPTQNSVRNAILSNLRMNINNCGAIANASIYESAGTRGTAANKANLIYTSYSWGGTGNFRGYSGNGIAQLFLSYNQNFFSNGAKIKIYKA
jgi:hypothetical protein